MPKICKEQFDISGTHHKRSYDKIELDLWYDGREHFFFFKKEDIEEKTGIKPPYNAFMGCKTREDALDIFKILMEQGTTKSRWLEIKIGVPARLYKIKAPKTSFDEDNEDEDELDFGWNDKFNPVYAPYIEEMVNGRSTDNGVNISFQRYVKIEGAGNAIYSPADKNWKENLGNRTTGLAGLIQWTQEREDFLIKTQAQLDKLGTMVLDFFNAPTLEDLCLKMERSNLALPEPDKK